MTKVTARPQLLLPAVLALGACTGEVMTDIFPGEKITVGGNVFTVNQTARGVTIQNFETGFTSPAVLKNNATIAAELVTGCKVDTIVKEGSINTYYASVSCPEV